MHTRERSGVGTLFNSSLIRLFCNCTEGAICCRLCGDRATSLYNTYHLTVARLNSVAAELLIAEARTGFTLLASVTANELGKHFQADNLTFHNREHSASFTNDL